MYNTAAISSQNKLTPPASGRPGAEPDQGQDFIAALSRLAYSSLTAAAIVPDAPIPDTTKPAPLEDRTSNYNGRTSDRLRDSDNSSAPPAPAEREQRAENAPSEPPHESLDRAGENRGSETPETQTARDDETREQAHSGTSLSGAPSLGVSPTSTPNGASGVSAHAERSGANAAQTPTAQLGEAEAPPPAPQQGRQAPNRAGNNPQPQIIAQTTSGGEGDRLPQIGHTLSSRAAVVAQSDSGKPGSSVAESGFKAAPSDPAAASLVTGAVSSGGQATKGKGQAKSGNGASGNATANNAAQNAAATQGNPSSAAQTQAAATLQSQQQNLATMQAGSGNGANPAGQQTSTMRTEPFPLAGNGPAASQFSPRGADPAQAAKSPPPVPARFVTNQVAVQIQKAFGEGGDRISIQLKPAELGRVEIRLDVGKDGRVTAVITADRADTLDLLQRDARILQNSLQNAGLQTDSNSLSFELKGQNQAFGQPSDGPVQAGPAAEGDGNATAVGDAIAAFKQTGVVTDDRVDIHV